MTVDELAIRLEQVEQRFDRLEQRPTLTFAGGWKGDVQYDIGSVVAWAGSMWVAEQPSLADRPGTARTSWRLWKG